MQHRRRREFEHRSLIFALAPGFGKLGYLEAGEPECIEERGWEAWSNAITAWIIHPKRRAMKNHLRIKLDDHTHKVKRISSMHALT